MLSKKIKILYPILHYPPVIGGLEQWSQNIAECQPDDIEILIVTGRVRGEPNFETRGNVEIFRTSLFPLADLSRSSLLYIACTAPFIFLRSLLLSGKVQIFHCHGFVSAFMGYFLSLLTQKPYIATEQSIKLRNPVSKFVSGIVYREASVCIAASKAVEEEFKKIGVKNTRIIPNGVDLEKFFPLWGVSRREINVRGSTPHISNALIILSVGRLEKVKGHRYLIEAFSEIKKEIPEAKLILVGDGSERGNLEKQADNLGLRGAIEFAGEIPHNELPHWYHKADIFVMPSLSEGFGITVIEAMACGVPVVASGVGGLLDIVEDRVTGFLATPGDPASLKYHILNILREGDVGKNISDNARSRVFKYSWNNIAKEISDIYNSQLKRSESLSSVR